MKIAWEHGCRREGVGHHGHALTRFLPASLLLLALLGGLGGCASKQVDELAAFSSITFSAPGFYLPPGSTLQWRSDLVYVFDDQREAPENVTPFLQSEIEEYLGSRNYSFVTDGAPADFGIVAAVVLGDDLTARDVLQQYRLTPSFKSSRRYKKGTIVIALYDAENEQVQWRGAIQANVDLAMPVEQRRQRVQSHTRRLLAMLPGKPPLN